MSASEEFHRATGKNPRLRSSPYELYQNQLNRGGDRRLEIQRQQGQIQAQNEANKWGAIADIPGQAIQGYQAGQNISGERQRQQLAEEQGVRDRNIDARNQEMHGVQMEQQGYKTDALSRKNQMEQWQQDFLSETEEGGSGPRWQELAGSEYQSKLDAPNLNKRMTEANIAGIEGTNRFNEFQMGQAELASEKAAKAETVQGAMNMLTQANRIADPQAKQQMIAEATQRLRGIGMTPAQAQAYQVSAEYQEGIESANLAYTKALGDQALPGVQETDKQIQTARMKVHGTQELIRAVNEYKQSSLGTDQSARAKDKALRVLSKMDPEKAQLLRDSWPYSPRSGTRSDVMDQIVQDSIDDLESELQMLRTGVAPDSGSLNASVDSVEKGIRQLKAMQSNKNQMQLTQPDDGMVEGFHHAGGRGPRSLRQKMTNQPPGSNFVPGGGHPSGGI